MPLFLLMAMAAFSITRLLTRDQFPPIEVQRERVAARWGDASWQAYLSRCPWCAGFYVSALVTIGTDLATSVPVPWLTAIGLRAAVGLLAMVDVALDRE